MEMRWSLTIPLISWQKIAEASLMLVGVVDGGFTMATD